MWSEEKILRELLQYEVKIIIDNHYKTQNSEFLKWSAAVTAVSYHTLSS